MTIQDGVDHLSAGDTLFLADGRFSGEGNRDVELRGHDIVIRSLSGVRGECVIDCAANRDEMHRAFWYHKNETAGAIVENLTIEGGYALGGGAAVLCQGGASPTFLNVHFRANARTAVTSFGGSSLFKQCLFEGNLDGALSCFGNARIRLDSCNFANNYVDGSGAAILCTSSFVTLEHCNFMNNNSTLSGGSIYSDRASLEDSVSVVARNCIFGGNVAGYYGGAIRCMQAALSITACTFLNNTAAVGGGAVDLSSSSGATIVSSTFYANFATSGAALRLTKSSNAEIDKTIIAFNLGAEALFCDSLTTTSTSTVRCSDIFGNEGGDWTSCIEGQLGGSNNLHVDPLFCGQFSGDLRLKAESQCWNNASCGTVGASAISCSQSSFALPHLVRSQPLERRRKANN